MIVCYQYNLFIDNKKAAHPVFFSQKMNENNISYPKGVTRYEPIAVWKIKALKSK